jgi:hypothetical protein
MQREQEKGVLLAPLKRQEHEWFTIQADREIDLMEQMGMLDDMPPELAEAGGKFQIVYENPLARARKAEQAGGFYQLLNGIAPLLQLDPEKGKELFRVYPFDKVLAGLGKIHAVPVEWEATEDQQKAFDEDVRALADKASLLEIGQAGAGIAKDLAQAEAMGANHGA